MRIQWDIEDGYAGKNRPHFVEVPDDEIEECETAEEEEKLIEEYVQNDFDQKISFYWKKV